MKWLLMVLLLTASCSDSPEIATQWTSPIPFDTATVLIPKDGDTVQLTVEVAGTSQERAFGLMTRPSLDINSGMIFRYEARQDTAAGFWMFRTIIPLDIAFIDSTGTIITIRSMEPCTSPNPEWCWKYTSEKPYYSALEVNRGFFAARGITTGDHVMVRGQ